MSRSVCTNKSSIFLMSLEKKHIAALVSESAGANAGGAFGVTGSYWNVSERSQFRRAELTVSARPFRGAPRGALGDDLACPAGVAIQIHRCNLGPLELFCSFFLAGRRFHSVCLFFSFCMHRLTINPRHSTARPAHSSPSTEQARPPSIVASRGNAEARLVPLLRRNSNHPRSEG